MKVILKTFIGFFNCSLSRIFLWQKTSNNFLLVYYLFQVIQYDFRNIVFVTCFFTQIFSRVEFLQLRLIKNFETKSNFEASLNKNLVTKLYLYKLEKCSTFYFVKLVKNVYCKMYHENASCNEKHLAKGVLIMNVP